jgi:hypothetical protein
MNAQRKTLIRLSEDVRDGFGRVAAKGFDKMQGQGQAPPFGGGQGGGGDPFQKGGNPFQKGGEGASTTRRQIPEDHEFDKKAVKPIVKTLWAMSVALGHALTAHRSFSRLKSSSFSPDGLLGGHGYVMAVKQIRQQLFESCEALSGLVDTLHDEINAPHWKPKIADLEKADMAEIERLLSDAEEWIDNPEEEVEEEQGDIKGNSSWSKDRFKKDKAGPGSGIPSGGDSETTQKSGPPAGDPSHPDMKHMKQSSAYTYNRTAALLTQPELLEIVQDVPQDWKPLLCGNCGAERIDVTYPCENCGVGGPVFLGDFAEPTLPEPQGCANCGSVTGYDKCGQLLCSDCRQPYYEKATYSRVEANSSVNPDTLPGPRVKHLDRGDSDQTGPGGSYNRDEKPVADQWGESGGVSGVPMSQNTGDGYNYPSDWSGDESAKWAKQGWDFGKYAASGVPDSTTESTPTEGFDFGIGDGNGNDAHGQGAGGYGVQNPSTPGSRGVYGPQAELPTDPAGQTKDHENDDSNAKIEQGIGNNSVPSVTASYSYCRVAATELPNDDDGPVARSDYYWGDKGNDLNYDKNHNSQSKTPGNQSGQPPAPLTPRPSHLYEHEFSAGSEVPGDENAIYESDPGYGVDEYHRVEHGDQPYVKYDDNTHEMRPDNTYQRGDLPAPYVNDDLA